MKNDLLFYRGYVATVWLDVKSGLLRGRVEKNPSGAGSNFSLPVIFLRRAWYNGGSEGGGCG